MAHSLISEVIKTLDELTERNETLLSETIFFSLTDQKMKQTTLKLFNVYNSLNLGHLDEEHLLQHALTLLKGN